MVNHRTTPGSLAPYSGPSAFGMLTITKVTYARNGRDQSVKVATCLCACGSTATIALAKVVTRSTRSCGCLQREMRANVGSHNRKAFGEAARNQTLATYRKSAEIRGHRFELAEDEFFDLVVRPCHYCGIAGGSEKRSRGMYGSFVYTGIDRIDSSIGYLPDNCVPCCRFCNRMKSNLPPEVFLTRVAKIATNLNLAHCGRTA